MFCPECGAPLEIMQVIDAETQYACRNTPQHWWSVAPGREFVQIQPPGEFTKPNDVGATLL